MLQVPGGIDWEDGEGEPAYLIVGIAASDNEHLAVLKRLSTVVGDEAVAERLAKTTDAEDIRRALSDVAGGESAAPQATASGKYVIGITSCPTGVAHTYMAQEALEIGARALGHEVKIETQGSVGAANVLTPQDIARADVVIIAADTNVDPARFAGKRLYRTGTKAAINDAAKVINTAFSEAPVFAADSAAAAAGDAKPERSGVYKHLMTGVSYMLPFVVAGGLLIALGFAFASFQFGEKGIFIYEDAYKGTFAANLFWAGKAAFELFIPVLGGLLGGMMALDMGGPVNKAAYTVSTALIGSNIFFPMAATMAAGMTPPLAIFCATLLFKNRFTVEEREAGKAAGILGLSFITEGAIPFAAKDPLRVIPALVIGSAVTGALSVAFGCGLHAPHGGVFVLFIPNAVDHVLLYAVAILAGTAVSTACLGVFKKRVSA